MWDWSISCAKPNICPKELILKMLYSYQGAWKFPAALCHMAYLGALDLIMTLYIQKSVNCQAGAQNHTNPCRKKSLRVGTQDSCQMVTLGLLSFMI